MDVLDVVLGRLRATLGPGWSVVPRQGGADLVRSGDRVVAAWTTERARLVAFIAASGEPLRPYAGSALLSLLAVDPAGEDARAALEALRRDLGLVEVPPADQAALLREAEALRVERARAIEREEAARRGREASTAERAAAAARLGRELGPGWTVEVTRYGAQVTTADGTAGVWLVLAQDPTTPAGLEALRELLWSCAAPFRLLGCGPSWTVVTWADRDGPRSRALADALRLSPPPADLEARLMARS